MCVCVFECEYVCVCLSISRCLDSVIEIILSCVCPSLILCVSAPASVDEVEPDPSETVEDGMCVLCLSTH